jgi:hypothetical protein
LSKNIKQLRDLHTAALQQVLILISLRLGIYVTGKEFKQRRLQEAAFAIIKVSAMKLCGACVHMQIVHKVMLYLALFA